MPPPPRRSPASDPRRSSSSRTWPRTTTGRGSSHARPTTSGSSSNRSRRCAWRSPNDSTRSDLPLSADPARSPFRIYRDVRFSKDKSPYKTNIGAAFRWSRRGRQRRPGRLLPPRAGRGLRRWRDVAPARRPRSTRSAGLLDTDPRPGPRDHRRARVQRHVRDAQRRPPEPRPAGLPADHPEAELLKLKDMTFGHRLADADVYSADLPDVLVESLAKAIPVMRLLATLPVPDGRAPFRGAWQPSRNPSAAGSRRYNRAVTT